MASTIADNLGGDDGLRTPVVAGNWKCHTRLASARQLVAGLRGRIDAVGGVEKVVCPPFVYLGVAAEALVGSSLRVGAQDIHWEDDVAATGQIGPKMLAELVQYVIIGHSERRHQLGETEAMVRRKVEAALAAGLKPIMCVGETLGEREAGRTEEVLVRQTRSALEGIDLPAGFIVAYEPVWAIGTGNRGHQRGRGQRHRPDQARGGGDVRAGQGGDGTHPLRRQRDGGERRRAPLASRDRRGAGGWGEPEGGCPSRAS